ncbi:MAG TPA: hypothetical protein VFJ07_25230, partial [Streptosporangiaceae bacterium]|nr:hypothetical protein [Streptosporangiaceae bacterium]
MRVLIVEDEPYMAEAICDGLRLEAIAADIAGDGNTAVELLSINAIVHNLPEQGTVWITTSVHPRGAMLTVENTGEKLPPQLVSTLTEP